MNDKNYVISIGRQLGSGGSTVGKAIADHFGFKYIDKEILLKAAEIMDLPEENLEFVDEKKTSVWMALAQTTALGMPYVAEEWQVPTGAQLFNTQVQIMKEAVSQGSCVIIGRCAPHLFRHYEKHTSIFLQADMESRMERFGKTIGKDISGEKGRQMMEKSDQDRAGYYNTYTGRKWMDLREYDFVLNTTPFTDEQVKKIVFDYICTRFPELKDRGL